VYVHIVFIFHKLQIATGSVYVRTTDCVQNCLIVLCKVINFHIHVDNPTDYLTSVSVSSVTFPTHNKHHILNFVVTFIHSLLAPSLCPPPVAFHLIISVLVKLY